MKKNLWRPFVIVGALTLLGACLIIYLEMSASPLTIEVVQVIDSDDGISVITKISNTGRKPILIGFSRELGEPNLHAVAVEEVFEEFNYRGPRLLERRNSVISDGLPGADYERLAGGGSMESTFLADPGERDTVVAISLFYYRASELNSHWADRLNWWLTDPGRRNTILERIGGWREARTEVKKLSLLSGTHSHVESHADGLNPPPGR